MWCYENIEHCYGVTHSSEMQSVKKLASRGRAVKISQPLWGTHVKVTSTPNLEGAHMKATATSFGTHSSRGFGSIPYSWGS